MALIPKKYRENYGQEEDRVDSTGADHLSGFNPDDRQDGREKEWQDRGRVQTERPDPERKTSIERDFEPEDNTPASSSDPAY